MRLTGSPELRGGTEDWDFRGDKGNSPERTGEVRSSDEMSALRCRRVQMEVLSGNGPRPGTAHGCYLAGSYEALPASVRLTWLQLEISTAKVAYLGMAYSTPLNSSARYSRGQTCLC